ncbi:response regulator [soil metagenome]
MSMPSILIVEDEALVRAELSQSFKEAGFSVVGARSGEEAERLMETHPEITGMVTDIDMPGMIDGIWLAWIAYKRDPSIDVIVISGQLKPAEDELPGNASFQEKPIFAETAVKEMTRMMCAH